MISMLYKIRDELALLRDQVKGLLLDRQIEQNTETGVVQGASVSGNRISLKSASNEQVIAEPPYTIFYNQGEGVSENFPEGFYVYVPKGCLYVDGEVVEFKTDDLYGGDCMKVSGLTVEGNTSEPETVYAHVRVTSSDGGREIGVTFDTKEKPEEAGGNVGGRSYDFIVGTFADTYTRICSSIVFLGETVIETPFQIKEVDGVKTITNNVFYFDGAEKKIADFENIPQTGFVYLTATKEAAKEGSAGKPEWSEFSLSTEEVKAPEGGRAFNIKLYEFENGKVKCDYRTTFLTLEGGEVFKLHIASEHTATSVAANHPPTASVSGDGTETNPLQFSFEIPQGVGIASIDVNESSESGGQTSITIILDDKEKTTKTFYVHNGQNGEKGKDGVGIASVTVNENSQPGEASAVTIKLSNGTTKTFYVHNGQDGEKGEKGEKGDKGDKGDTGASGSNGKDGVGIASVTVNENSQPGEASAVTIKLSNGTTKTFYVHNGQNGEKGVVDETRLYDLQVNGNTLGKVVDGPGGNIIQKQLAAGSGIEITPNGNVLTISATESNATSGFTGIRTILKDVRYESPYLQKKLIQETWKDGVLTNSVEGEWETYHTAVEETV